MRGCIYVERMVCGSWCWLSIPQRDYREWIGCFCEI